MPESMTWYIHISDVVRLDVVLEAPFAAIHLDHRRNETTFVARAHPSVCVTVLGRVTSTG
jgi:hypothetical protein